MGACAWPSSVSLRLPPSPVAVPGIFVADGAASSAADRGHSLPSLPPPPAAVGSLPIRKFPGDSLHTFSSVRKYGSAKRVCGCEDPSTSAAPALRMTRWGRFWGTGLSAPKLSIVHCQLSIPHAVSSSVSTSSSRRSSPSESSSSKTAAALRPAESRLKISRLRLMFILARFKNSCTRASMSSLPS